MADNKKERRPRLPKNASLDAKIAARKQQEMDGFVDKYNDILKQREIKYAQLILPEWRKFGQSIVQQMTSVMTQAQGGITPAIMAKLNRLQLLTGQSSEMIRLLEGQTTALTNQLAYTYTESYYFHAFGLEQAAKLQVVTPLLTHSHVMGVLANPWLPDGATYSDRIRANTAFLATKMREKITEAIATGQGSHETARRIMEVTGEGYHNAVRLARTELGRAASQGANHLFMQNADILDGKRWRATLDARTAPKDADNDGKEYALDYDTPENPGLPGERIPNHPNCRCKYSPVIAGLGPREGERIARGDGDTPNNFGARTYTKAKNYREYAKERGLPDLDERLAKDDPRKYLRPEDNGVPKPAAAAPTFPDTAVGRAQARLAQGALNTPQEVIALGKPLREEASKRVQEVEAEMHAQGVKTQELFVKLDKAQNRWMQLDGDEADEALEEVARLDTEHTAARAKAQQLAKKAADARRFALRDVLDEVRPFGGVPVSYAPGSDSEGMKYISEAAGFFPESWLQQSAKSNILAGKVDRGYYRPARGGEPAHIMLSGSSEHTLRRVAVHELSHRMEGAVQGISEMERKFYEYRTQGESFERLESIYPGTGYRPEEIAKKDNFANAYAGKWYGGDFFELLSMGTESLFYDAHGFDDEFKDFITGVLAGI